MDHPHDCTECISSSLDLFGKPQIQVAFEEKRTQTHQAKSSFDLDQPLTFCFKTSSEEYLDASSITLFMKLKIVDSANANLAGPVNDVLPDRSIAFPINNIASTLWKQVCLKIHGQVITKNNNMYHYRAIIEKLLSYSGSVLASSGSRSGFHLDTGDVHVHGATIKGENYKANAGALARFKMAAPSKTIEVCDKLHVELCNQEKLIPPNTEITIEFFRNSNKFCIMGHTTAANYRIKILDAFLECRVHKVSKSILEGHRISLQHQPYLYLYRQPELRYFGFTANSTVLNLPNFYNDTKTPRRVVFGLVRSSAFNGSYEYNGLAFENFKIREFILRNHDNVVAREISCDYPGNAYTQAYNNFLCESGLLDETNKGTIVSQEIFKNSCNLYCFDLTTFFAADDYVLDVNRNCNLGVEIKLAEPLAQNVQLICYLEFDTFLKLDKNNQVHTPSEN